MNVGLFGVGVCLAAALGAHPIGAQSVHVVDLASGPGTDFTTLTAAIETASAGDILLVRPGIYDEPIALDGKALSIQADSGLVRVSGICLSNQAATDTVLVRGVEVRGGDVVCPGGSFRPVFLRDGTGVAWLENVRLTEFSSPGISLASILIKDAGTLVLTHSEIGSFLPNQPSESLLAVRSRVFAFDTELRGSPGFDDTIGLTLPTVGSVAVATQAGLMALHGGSAVGGRGGNSAIFPGADGGPGLRTFGASPEVFLRDIAVAGGAGGVGVPNGAAAPAIDQQSGTILQSSAVHRSYTASSPARDDESVTVTLDGLAGDQVWIAYAIGAGTGSTIPQLDGYRVLQAPLAFVSLGRMPTSGTLTRSFPLRDLGPGVEGAVVYTQAYFRDANGGGFVIGSPSAVTVVDRAF